MKINIIITWLVFGLTFLLTSCEKEEGPELEPAASKIILYDSNNYEEVRAEITSNYQEKNVNFISCYFVSSDETIECLKDADISTCAIGYNIILFSVKGIKGGHPVTIKVTSRNGESRTLDLVVQPGTCVLKDVFKS